MRPLNGQTRVVRCLADRCALWLEEGTEIREEMLGGAARIFCRRGFFPSVGRVTERLGLSLTAASSERSVRSGP